LGLASARPLFFSGSPQVGIVGMAGPIPSHLRAPLCLDLRQHVVPRAQRMMGRFPLPAFHIRAVRPLKDRRLLKIRGRFMVSGAIVRRR